MTASRWAATSRTSGRFERTLLVATCALAILAAVLPRRPAGRSYYRPRRPLACCAHGRSTGGGHAGDPLHRHGRARPSCAAGWATTGPTTCAATTTRCSARRSAPTAAQVLRWTGDGLKADVPERVGGRRRRPSRCSGASPGTAAARDAVAPLRDPHRRQRRRGDRRGRRRPRRRRHRGGPARGAGRAGRDPGHRPRAAPRPAAGRRRASRRSARTR